MSTPHIHAAPGAFADTVLLPGDPLRARHVATTLLDDAVEVTAVRGMLGYTGTWKGVRVSVMGSGIGIPSCTLYATELARHYGVRRLLRVGTCGAVLPDVALGDLVLALAAGTDSAAPRRLAGEPGWDLPLLASWPLLEAVRAAAADAGEALRVGPVFSGDLFYDPAPDVAARLARHGVLGIEMEAAGLFAVAAREGIEAGALLTVTDHLVRGEAMPAAERERGVDRMLRLALDAAVRPAA